MGSRLMSIADAAKTLAVSKDTIRRLIKASELKSVRVSRRVLVPQSEIDRACTHGIATKGK